MANSDGAGRELYLLPNELKVPYSDQFSLGVRSPAGDWNLQASLAQIYTKDGFAWLLANRRADGNFLTQAKPGARLWGNGIPGYGNTLIGGSGLKPATARFICRRINPVRKVIGVYRQPTPTQMQKKTANLLNILHWITHTSRITTFASHQRARA